MHPFTIDFITGNVAPYTATEFNYGYAKQSTTVSGEESIAVPEVDNYFNTTQNLEDVYSVINNDTAVSSPESEYLAVATPSPPSEYSHHSTSSPESELQSVDVQGRDLPYPQPKYRIMKTESHYQTSDVQESVSPPPQPEYSILTTSSPESEYLTIDVQERGTPSPTRDSGIESTGCSPVQTDSSLNVKQALNDLDKKAKNLTKSAISTEKPGLSYIALIAQAIISARGKKMTLGDIYKHIRDNHSYYDNEERAWRNSIRYNLSINECFIKAGKEESGKGNYWAIHDQCLSDFTKGDYRRRQARRRARRGTRTLDTEPANPYVFNNTQYTPMTSSFLGYQPYPSSAMVPRHPYGVAAPQLYPTQKRAFTHDSQPIFSPGNQIYPNATDLKSYHSYLAATPYSYMTTQGTEPKVADVYGYNPTNSVVIQS